MLKDQIAYYDTVVYEEGYRFFTEQANSYSKNMQIFAGLQTSIGTEVKFKIIINKNGHFICAIKHKLNIFLEVCMITNNKSTRGKVRITIFYSYRWFGAM